MTSGKERKNVDRLVSLPVDLNEAVKQRAAAEERSVAATIRIALRMYLDRDEEPGRGEGAP